MRRKWNDARGETLVEVLASILICSLSVALLFSMVMASGNMDRSAKKVEEDFSESLNLAEAQTAPADPALIPSGAKVEVQYSGKPDKPGKPGKPSSTKQLTVAFYGGRGALSYALPSGGGQP